MDDNPPHLQRILKGTSRAFYLSLAVLPRPARVPLSLAYLLARAADTVADAEGDADSDRAALLRRLQADLRAPGTAGSTELFGALHPTREAERELLRCWPELCAIVSSRPETEREAIVEVVTTLIEGMLWDQQLFDASTPCTEGLSSEQLERYTFLVAGCVGPFWSKVCALSDPRLRLLAADEHRDLAIEFGKGLQWVNILRDVRDDQLQGRFYLPSLDHPDFSERFLAGCRRAFQALGRATAYPTLFPASYLRHRMAVFWPLVLGWRTLEKRLRAERQGASTRRVKVPRWEVLTWVALSPGLVCHNTVVRRVLTTLEQRAYRALREREEREHA